MAKSKKVNGKPILENKKETTKEPKTGRPTIFTKELADLICEQLAEGASLSKVCIPDEMPAARTVFRWLRTDEGFCQQYARAKQESADAMAEDILDISDNGSNDWMEKQYGRDAESTWVVNGEALQRSKLRVDTRKWLMAKMKPKKYADKLDLTTDGEKLPVPIMSVVASKQQDVSRNNVNTKDKGTDEES